jgi:dual specificity MAP kinase phosphatase
MSDSFSELEQNFPHLVSWDSKGRPRNYIDFALREREEMCNLTRASEICDGFWVGLEPSCSSSSADWSFPAQLGNSNDVPVYQNGLMASDPFNGASENNPLGFDICVECCDGVSFPSAMEMASAAGHIQKLDELWAARCLQNTQGDKQVDQLPTRPPPNANHVLHLAFPSSPIANQYTLNHVLAFVSFLQHFLYPEPAPSSSSTPSSSSLNILSPSPLPYGSSSSLSSHESASYSHHRGDSSGPSKSKLPRTSRRCRILLFSTDGYTETSILGLCMLMAPKPAHYTSSTQPASLNVFTDPNMDSQQADNAGNSPALHRAHSTALAKSYTTRSGSNTTGMSLPDAYLELQIARGRSFYVYPSDMELLKKAEARLYSASRELAKDRGRDREISSRRATVNAQSAVDTPSQLNSNLSKWKWSTWGSRTSFSIPVPPPEEDEHSQSTSAASAMLLPMMSSSTPNSAKVAGGAPRGRARASTSPMPQVWADHWAWFSDPRFDGSFPSRVLPFLYLGNL